MFNYLSSYLTGANQEPEPKNEELSNNRKQFDNAGEMNQYNNWSQDQQSKKMAS